MILRIRNNCFHFLIVKWSVHVEGKYIDTIAGVSVAFTCDYEEANTKMLFHVQDALDNGATMLAGYIRMYVHTVDTDVIVIFAGKLRSLLERQPVADVWQAFGAGSRFKQIHVNAVYKALEKSSALPIY